MREKQGGTIMRNRRFCNRIRQMRMIVCICCVISMIAAGITPAYAAETTAKLTASAETAAQGSTASVKVDLSGNTGIWGLKLKVIYDHEALKLTSVTNGSIFDQKEVTYSTDQDPFVYLAYYEKIQNGTENGRMASLNFKVLSQTVGSTYPITLDVVQVIDVDGKDVALETQDGMVTVVSGSGSSNSDFSGSDYTDNSSTETKTEKPEEKPCQHKKTEVKNAVSAKETKSGYTGDVYCADCGQLIEEGKTIAAFKKSVRKLSLRVSGSTETKNVLKWKKVSGADGYVIYGSVCEEEFEKQTVIKKGSTTTWTDKKLDPGTYYQYYITAYKLVNGKKLWIAKSPVIYATTDGGEYGNVTTVTVNKESVTLKKGKTFKIKAEQTADELPIEEQAEIRYESGNTKVATVNSKGVITAKKAGSCDIYVFAQNGIYTKIRVKVK